MLRCAPRRRATAPAPASPPRHYRAARRRRAPPPRAATARRPTALRAPPPPTPPPCWHTPTASRAPPHRDTTATAPPRRLAAASGGRRACREGRAADFRARDAQASSCSGFLTDGTGSTGEATLRVRDDHFSKRSSVAGPARTRATCVMVARFHRSKTPTGYTTPLVTPRRPHVGRQLALDAPPWRRRCRPVRALGTGYAPQGSARRAAWGEGALVRAVSLRIS